MRGEELARPGPDRLRAMAAGLLVEARLPVSTRRDQDRLINRSCWRACGGGLGGRDRGRVRRGARRLARESSQRSVAAGLRGGGQMDRMTRQYDHRLASPPAEGGAVSRWRPGEPARFIFDLNRFFKAIMGGISPTISPRYRPSEHRITGCSAICPAGTRAAAPTPRRTRGVEGSKTVAILDAIPDRGRTAARTCSTARMYAMRHEADVDDPVPTKHDQATEARSGRDP